jgi:hypothetical protein
MPVRRPVSGLRASLRLRNTLSTDCLRMLPRIFHVFCLWLLTLIVTAGEPLELRGYYITFMRMPVMGLPEWKRAVDCFAEDEINTLVLWMPGGFRSRKFPITWRYNEEHANVRQDFVRELIDYAHTRKIRVLLGFTPFGYDGINQFPLEQPELKAKKPDGAAVDEFGIHCWGWSLCPAQPESQRLMREYLREMIVDFYPNADGLLIESSDYNVCQCPQCGARHYDHEFGLVRWVSDEMWKVNSKATILVYPHYFTGKKVPGLDVRGAKQPFDPRWGLFFTPHSAHFDEDLIRRAQTSVFSGPEAVLGTPQAVASSAQAARRHGVRGFLPSLEAFSYIPTRPERGEKYVVGKRMRPFGLNAEREGKMPFDGLLPRVQRFAVREFSQDPDLTFADFVPRLQKHVFGANEPKKNVSDLLALQQIWTQDADWYWSSPLLDPDLLRERAHQEKWLRDKLERYDRNLIELREISRRYEKSSTSAEIEMSRLAEEVVQRWGDRKPSEVGASRPR